MNYDAWKSTNPEWEVIDRLQMGLDENVDRVAEEIRKFGYDPEVLDVPDINDYVWQTVMVDGTSVKDAAEILLETLEEEGKLPAKEK